MEIYSENWEWLEMENIWSFWHNGIEKDILHNDGLKIGIHSNMIFIPVLFAQCVARRNTSLLPDPVVAPSLSPIAFCWLDYLRAHLHWMYENYHFLLNYLAEAQIHSCPQAGMKVMWPENHDADDTNSLQCSVVIHLLQSNKLFGLIWKKKSTGFVNKILEAEENII